MTTRRRSVRPWSGKPAPAENVRHVFVPRSGREDPKLNAPCDLVPLMEPNPSSVSLRGSADRGRFELPVDRSGPQWFSRPPPSATRPPIRKAARERAFPSSSADAVPACKLIRSSMPARPRLASPSLATPAIHRHAIPVISQHFLACHACPRPASECRARDHITRPFLPCSSPLKPTPSEGAGLLRPTLANTDAPPGLINQGQELLLAD